MLATALPRAQVVAIDRLGWMVERTRGHPLRGLEPRGRAALENWRPLLSRDGHGFFAVRPA